MENQSIVSRVLFGVLREDILQPRITELSQNGNTQISICGSEGIVFLYSNSEQLKNALRKMFDEETFLDLYRKLILVSALLRLKLF